MYCAKLNFLYYRQTVNHNLLFCTIDKWSTTISNSIGTSDLQQQSNEYSQFLLYSLYLFLNFSNNLRQIYHFISNCPWIIFNPVHSLQICFKSLIHMNILEANKNRTTECQKMCNCLKGCINSRDKLVLKYSSRYR